MSLEETYETAPPLRLTAGLAMVALGTIAWTVQSMDYLMALDGRYLATFVVLLIALSAVLRAWFVRSH